MFRRKKQPTAQELANRPTPQAPTFDHTTAEADAEQTLRNLPLP